MNKHKQAFQAALALSSLLVATVAAFSAQAAMSPGHVYDVGTGNVVRDGSRQCVRTTFWQKENAIKECNPELFPEPKVVAAPPPPPPPPVVAAPPPKPIPVVKPPRVERISLSGDAHFEFGKSELNPKGIAELEGDFKGKLKELQFESIVITGHTDNVGPAQFNQELSLRRAEAVKAFAISRGMDGSKIQTVGRGETNPIADNKTAEGRAQNRRVDVEIKGTRTGP